MSKWIIVGAGPFGHDFQCLHLLHLHWLHQVIFSGRFILNSLSLAWDKLIINSSKRISSIIILLDFDSRAERTRGVVLGLNEGHMPSDYDPACLWVVTLVCFRVCWVLLDTDHRLISNKVHPALPSSAIPSVPRVRSYFRHISNTPPFIPVPLVSPFVPMFPVSLISVSMPLWSSHLSYKFSPPCSCLPLFHTSTFVPSPWPSQANPAA